MQQSQATVPTKLCVIIRPVRHLHFHLRNVVLSVSIMFYLTLFSQEKFKMSEFYGKELSVQQRGREDVYDETLALRLQREGADSFAASWQALLARIHEKCATVGGNGA